MKGKGVVFVLVVLLWQMASGLKMCQGPFKPPSIDEARIDPIYKSGTKDVLVGAKVLVKMSSSVPLTAHWKTRSGAAEGNPSITSFMKADGESYIFRMEDREKRYPSSDIIPSVTNGTVMTVRAEYSCNTVEFVFQMHILIKMAKQSVAIPTIKEMPSQNYIVEPGSLENITTTVSFSGGDNEDLKIRPHCQKLFLRIRDKLAAVYRLPLRRPENPDSYKDDKAGIAQGTCVLKKMQYYIQSTTLGFQTEVLVGREMYFSVFMTTEIGRADLGSKPAVMVESEPFGNGIWMHRGDVIPATKNTTRVTCLTDAGSVRNVTLSEYIGIGEKKVLTPKFSTTDEIVPSIRYFVYDIDSPPDSYIVDYECTVVDGYGRKNTLGFQVGATPVRMTEEEPKMIYLSQLNESTPNTLRLQCDATGSPKVDLKIYAGIKPFAYPLSPVRFQWTFDDKKQMKDTTDHMLYFTRRGARAMGLLFIPDVRDLVPSGYWDDPQNYVYTVVCLAYNSGEGKLQPLVNIFR